MLGIIAALLLLFAVVFFALATFNVPSHPRFVWMPAGLLFLTIYFLIMAAPHISTVPVAQ